LRLLAEWVGMALAASCDNNKKSQPFPSSPRTPAARLGFCGFTGQRSRARGLGYAAATELSGGAALASGYCVKCKASREIKDPQQITMKNGRPATQGTCPVCGTKIFKIGAST
jgi:hypothetical protein